MVVASKGAWRGARAQAVSLGGDGCSERLPEPQPEFHGESLRRCSATSGVSWMCWCGDGLLLGQLARTGRPVVGVEPDRVAIAAARRRGAGVSNAAVVEAGYMLEVGGVLYVLGLARIDLAGTSPSRSGRCRGRESSALCAASSGRTQTLRITFEEALRDVGQCLWEPGSTAARTTASPWIERRHQTDPRQLPSAGGIDQGEATSCSLARAWRTISNGR